jgi:prolyl-tRNA editing enzyme YbaK/EbsC (Cys-tRNA(Pro) deacylase)
VRSSVHVHNHLVEREVPHELIPARGRLRSAERIAAVLDLPPEQVGKVRVYESTEGPVAVVVPSHRDPDPDLVRAAMGADVLTAAAPSRASQLSEYLAEAIPPVGLPQGFRVLMDSSLAEQEVLYFAGGEATAILKVRAADLARAAAATVAPITSEV